MIKNEVALAPSPPHPSAIDLDNASFEQLSNMARIENELDRESFATEPEMPPSDDNSSNERNIDWATVGARLIGDFYDRTESKGRDWMSRYAEGYFDNYMTKERRDEVDSEDNHSDSVSVSSYESEWELGLLFPSGETRSSSSSGGGSSDGGSSNSASPPCDEGFHSPTLALFPDFHNGECASPPPLPPPAREEVERPQRAEATMSIEELQALFDEELRICYPEFQVEGKVYRKWSNSN